MSGFGHHVRPVACSMYRRLVLRFTFRQLQKVIRLAAGLHVNNYRRWLRKSVDKIWLVKALNLKGVDTIFVPIH